MRAPQRRHFFSASIGADSADELRRVLEEICAALDEQVDGQSTFGSPSSGGSWAHVVDREQTAERYREQLGSWIAAERKERGL